MSTGCKRAAVMVSALGVLAVPTSAMAKNAGLEAYQIKLRAGQLAELAKAGYDVTEGRNGNTLEIVSTAGQAAKLKDDGFNVALKRNGRGETAQQFDARIQRPDGSYDNYRPYWDDTYVGRDANGKKRLTLYQELRKLAQDHPKDRQGRGHRAHDQRRPHPRAEGDQERAQRHRRIASRGPLLVQPARA